MRILIAGGGVGGLTLALMLREKGIEGQVFEAAAEVRPLGVGINALPHSVRELAALGLLPALDAIAIRTRKLTYANHLGQEIWSEPRGMHAGHDVPQFSIHRGRLQEALWRAATERLGAAAPRADRRLVSCAQDGERVVARFRAADSTETEEVGDALVGADGIHSALRAALHPDDPGIRWNGIQMWRGALDWPAFGDGESMVIAGDAVAKLVLYPIAPGDTPGTRLTNWVIYARIGAPGEPPPRRENWSRLGRYEDFRHLVERLDLPFIDAGAMIRATREIFEYPMCDRDPLPWWSRGRVTLLGDAAHPMYPVGSNGASQAILDARCLTELLASGPVPEALRAYEAERLPATAAVVASNRVGGPERVIDVIAERAPGGFAHIGDVAGEEELEGIVRGYARLAGFAVARPA
ncbi:flavin-dependent oxidoreductase [Muricoccus pecuniae]|uniref:2-polyprenyl-6-methoxyphenol hydroxylase-like FAD-dependent oxidoreductase n=1 Tax=Muricoccus pecuniae TaxID=693023 RepID=A0A840YF39_9PROT|nr:flavin-dependent oxidoreductase [Roseomonas pecuniae]MBB5692503.1 2-polyprenyl-6-methoxyphenol hydroxylase-like FAD-dependent oxidoreductase [Roseomonas pecuniae]